MRECARVLGNRRLLAVLLLLLVLNVWLYLRQETKNQIYDQGEYSARYRALVAQCGKEDPEAALQTLTEQLNEASRVSMTWSVMRDREENPELYELMLLIYQEDEDFLHMVESGEFPFSEEEASLRMAVCSQMIGQLQYFIEYPQYLQQVKDNAEQMQKVSIFSDPNSFAYQNIQKTVKDFAGMDGAVLSLGEDQAVTSLFQDKLVDYSIVLFQMLVCASLLTERKKGLWSMIHASAGGRFPLAFKRALILLLSAALACIVLLGGKMAAASYLYGGFGDPNRLIQSMEMFRGVPTPTTLFRFFLHYLTVKIAGTFLLGLCLWLILSSIGNTSLAFAAGGLFLAFEYACFTLIRDSYLLVPLRYANIFAYVEYQPIYSRYLNISVFGLVASAHNMTLFLLPLFLLLSGGGALLVQVKKKPVTPKNRLEKLLDRFRFLTNRLCGYFGAFGMELYKLLWVQKGIFLLILLIWLQVTGTGGPYLYQSPEEAQKNYYAGQMEGPADENAREKLRLQTEELQGRMEELSREIEAAPENASLYQYELGKLSDKLSAINALQGELDRLSALEERTGIRGWLLNDTFYQCLVSEKTETYRQETALTALLFLVLMLAGSFAYENQQGTVFMMKAYRKGRTSFFWKKASAALLVAAVLWAAIYGREIQLAAHYSEGIPALNAPVQSVALLESFPLSVSLGGFLALLYGMRLLTLWAVTGLVLWTSSYLNRLDNAVVVEIVLWLLPAGLAVMQVATISNYTFLSPLSGVKYLLTGSFWVYGLMAALLIGSLGLLWRKWERAA